MSNQASSHTQPPALALKILTSQVKQLRVALRRAEQEQLTAARIKQEIFQLTDTAPTPPQWTLEPHKKSGHGPGVPTLLLSDWHWGEVVDPRQVDGLNAFNLTIARKRAKTLVDNTVDLLENHTVNPEFPGIVVALGGDFVSGDIHDELKETNEKPLMPVVIDVFGTLIWVLETLADRFGRVFVPAVAGNHGRSRQKPQHKNYAFTNYDWLLYQLLAKYFEKDKRFSFLIPDGPDAYYRIYNHRYLLTHGNQFRGGDGLIGPLGPLCVSPDTLILKTDLTYVRADTLQPGEEIVGFDECAAEGDRRKFRTAYVEESYPLELECYEIETEDGQKTIASIDHPWLCRSGGAHAFIKTKDLRIDTRILSLGFPWQHEHTWEAGYLAGVLDGEGSLDTTCGRLKITQQDNACLQKTLSILSARGIPYRISENDAARRGYEPCYNVMFFNGQEGPRDKVRVHSWRLLGTVRAERIIQEKIKESWEGVSVQVATEVRVVGIRKVGKHPVQAFSTSTRTFVGNGMLMHNTRGDHKKRSRNMESTRPYDTLVVGHFHQLIQLRRIIVNSSLKGYCEFAYDNNFPFELPQQALWLTHPRRGITISMPVHVDQAPRMPIGDWVSIRQ